MAAYSRDTLLPMVASIRSDPQAAALEGLSMFSVIDKSRKAALDMRLLDPTLSDSKDTKANYAVANLLKEYKASKGINGTQLLFLDTSVPKTGKFSVYQAVKDKLLAEGVPANEIAFIHDYDNPTKKRALIHAVNKGTVRIVLGSTSKLGTVINLQERIVAVHHLDIGWNLGTYLQRNGRAYRQGNINSEVRMYLYATEKSADVYMWDKIRAKARAFDAIMTGDPTVRRTEDLSSEGTMTAGEFAAVASGNPLMRERSELEKAINTLRASERGHTDSLKKLKRDKASRETFAEAYPARKAALANEEGLWGAIDSFTASSEEPDRLKLSNPKVGKALAASVKAFETSSPELGQAISLGAISGDKGAIALQLVMSEGDKVVVSGKAYRGTTIGRLVGNAKSLLAAETAELLKSKKTNDKELAAIAEGLTDTFSGAGDLKTKESRLAVVVKALAEVEGGSATETPDFNKGTFKTSKRRGSSSKQAISEVQRIVGKAVTAKAAHDFRGDEQGRFDAARKAVEITCQHSTDCGMGVDVLRVDTGSPIARDIWG